jgi:DNA-binding beta-propeller fold protein YncE
VYLAPIITTSGQLALRVFVVNFESSTIQILDPSDPDLALVDTLYVGAGPFGMAFDPFTLEDVVASSLNGTVVPELEPDPNVVNPDTSCPAGQPVDPKGPCLSRYRFAYIASFTDSYVQVIDLDARQRTFETTVYNLGYPTPPKGTQ